MLVLTSFIEREVSVMERLVMGNIINWEGVDGVEFSSVSCGRNCDRENIRMSGHHEQLLQVCSAILSEFLFYFFITRLHIYCW